MNARMTAPNDSPRPSPSPPARFWLGLFFQLCNRAPALLTIARPLVCAALFAFSAPVRRATTQNARLLLGPTSTRLLRLRLAWRTLTNFYLVCCDIGQSRNATIHQL